MVIGADAVGALAGGRRRGEPRRAGAGAAMSRRVRPVQRWRRYGLPVGDSSRNKQVVERFMELVDRGGDLDELDTLCSPDFVNHAMAPGRPNGVSATREFLNSPGRQSHAGRWVERVMVAEGDYVIEFGVRAGRWPGGPFRGIDVPSGPFERDAAFMYRLADGRLAERWAIRDDLGLMLQLGAITSAVSTD